MYELFKRENDNLKIDLSKEKDKLSKEQIEKQRL